MVFDIILSVLLIGAMSIGVVIHFKIQKLEVLKDEIAKITTNLDVSITKAQDMIDFARSSTHRGTKDLESAVNRGSIVKDELAFLVENAGKLLTKLDQSKIDLPAKKRRKQKLESDIILNTESALLENKKMYNELKNLR